MFKKFLGCPCRCICGCVFPKNSSRFFAFNLDNIITVFVGLSSINVLHISRHFLYRHHCIYIFVFICSTFVCECWRGLDPHGNCVLLLGIAPRKKNASTFIYYVESTDNRRREAKHATCFCFCYRCCAISEKVVAVRTTEPRWTMLHLCVWHENINCAVCL